MRDRGQTASSSRSSLSGTANWSEFGGLSDISRALTASLFVGIGERGQWGQGLGTEAYTSDLRIRDSSFVTFTASRWRSTATMAGPIRLYERLGFRLVGRLAGDRVNGRAIDGDHGPVFEQPRGAHLSGFRACLNRAPLHFRSGSNARVINPVQARSVRLRQRKLLADETDFGSFSPNSCRAVDGESGPGADLTVLPLAADDIRRPPRGRRPADLLCRCWDRQDAGSFPTTLGLHQCLIIRILFAAPIGLALRS